MKQSDEDNQSSLPLDTDEAPEVDLDSLVDDTPVGSMTLTFYDQGGTIYPKVSFAPIGRIMPNYIDKYLPHIYREIEIAQAQQRRVAAGLSNERPGVVEPGPELATNYDPRTETNEAAQ